MHARTARLDLHRPVPEDLDALHDLSSDPRVWAHFPSLRHVDAAQTRSMLEAWMADWERDGLGTWIIRRRDRPKLIGYGGCSARGHGDFWNLGYRFRPETQGQGFATEVSREALIRAHGTAPDRPVVAYLVEHNEASARVATHVGLELRHRAPDAGNPDPDVMRLVYSDRPLHDEQLAAVLQ